MARGFVWAVYVTDAGAPYALLVDAERVLDAERGWSTDGVNGLPPFPRGWRPREAVGFDDSGRTQTCRVATTSADLWSGTVIDFVFEATDGTLQVARVTELRGEQLRPTPPAGP